MQEDNKIQQDTVNTESNENNETKTSYAVRPHHRQRRLIDYDGRDKMLKVRNKLNIAFMLLAVIGLILWTQTEYQTASTIVLIVGVVLKIIEVCLRLFKK